MTQDGMMLIQTERVSQEQKGYTHERDKGRVNELIQAAQAYEDGNPQIWPWGYKTWKPTNALRDLVKSGALYQAAVDQGHHQFLDPRDRVVGKINAILAEAKSILIIEEREPEPTPTLFESLQDTLIELAVDADVARVAATAVIEEINEALANLPTRTLNVGVDSDEFYFVSAVHALLEDR